MPNTLERRRWLLAALVVGSAACSRTGGSSVDSAVDDGVDASSGDDASPGPDASSADAADPACTALGLKLQTAIDAHFNASPAQTVGGASVAVIVGSCHWVGVVGEAHPGVPMTPAHMFRVASVTKTYVAATLLQLVDEGALSLDNTLEQYVPGVPGGSSITIRMLLNHTSGIFDYATDATFWQNALSQPNVAVTPQALVDVATSHPANFAPGQGVSYTNTGFILAGMVIEAVTNTSVSAAIRQRTLDPVGLDATFFDGEETLPAPIVTATGQQNQDVTYALHPSINWAAGSMVTTAKDLAEWAAALYGGNVLSANGLNAMMTPVATGSPGLSYGLGAYLYAPSRLGNIGPGVGHNGRIPGFATNMFYMLNDGTVVVQIDNAETGKNFAGIVLATIYSL